MIQERGQEDLLYKVKHDSYEELDNFAAEIREKLIQDVSQNGGHLASNLGAVELTIALHRSFSSPKDKIIFDVGHQSYVHKMITGRWDSMSSLRQRGGISGFPKRSESVHDAFDSGHSGGSISQAYGLAKARDLSGDKYYCVAVIGDGALTGGVAYEALNNAGAEKTPIIVVLNDNHMSISRNVGGLARHLQRLRTSKTYLKFKKNIKSRSDTNPVFVKRLTGFRDRLKNSLLPGVIFENLGFKYLGPVNGHNIPAMVSAFEAAKSWDRPVLVHVVTQKGKGFAPAEQNPAKFHGIGPFNPNTVTAIDDGPDGSYSEVFGNCLNSIMDSIPNVVAVTAAMTEGTGLKPVKEKFPGRLFDVGIAEQHAVSFAAGLALGGKVPVVAVYSTFLQRAYDQIITEICLQQLPVVFAIDRAGVTGRDGETHQGIFDIAYLSTMPGMTILSPKDESELKFMLNYAVRLGKPVAVRYPRGKAYRAPYPCTSMKPDLLKQGKEAAILATGSMVPYARMAAQKMHSYAAVYNIKQLKPLDLNFIAAIFEKYPVIITLEDGVMNDGFGASVARLASQRGRTRVLNLGWPMSFIEHGSQDELFKAYGLDPDSIAAKAEAFIEAKA